MTSGPLINQKFGDLKVIRKSDRMVRSYWWVCKCWCDNIRVVEETRLMSGPITTCTVCEVRPNWRILINKMIIKSILTCLFFCLAIMSSSVAYGQGVISPINHQQQVLSFSICHSFFQKRLNNQLGYARILSQQNPFCRPKFLP